ncbi:MAG TPA: hypothetical protein DIS93_03070 [Bdellovibrionales bacterium]|nr:hypothetical protein [Bdellovibrionales bacterium]
MPRPLAFVTREKPEPKGGCSKTLVYSAKLQTCIGNQRIPDGEPRGRRFLFRPFNLVGKKSEKFADTQSRGDHHMLGVRSNIVFQKLFAFALCIFWSASASAVVFTCNIQKVPAIGGHIDPSRDVKIFEFDTSDVPAGKTVEFRGFRMVLHSDGKLIKMDLSSPSHRTSASIASYDSSIYAQLDEDATGVCFTEDATKDATPVEDSSP